MKASIIYASLLLPAQGFIAPTKPSSPSFVASHFDSRRGHIPCEKHAERQDIRRFHQQCRIWRVGGRRRSFCGLSYSSESSADGSNEDAIKGLEVSELDAGANASQQPSFDSPVLRSIWSDLQDHFDQYGHVNVPLGNALGRQCQTLRRLKIKNELSETDVAWLTDREFTFHSLEDVYFDVDFDKLLERLLKYEAENPDSNYQVPKKYAPDPELGAWVTGLRRLHKQEQDPLHDDTNSDRSLDPDHRRRLDEIGFSWISARQCGSKFMTKYRELVEAAEKGDIKMLTDAATTDWMSAQRMKLGELSSTRRGYLVQLVHNTRLAMGDDEVDHYEADAEKWWRWTEFEGAIAAPSSK